jgi:hypothetical protein
MCKMVYIYNGKKRTFVYYSYVSRIKKDTFSLTSLLWFEGNDVTEKKIRNAERFE